MPVHPHTHACTHTHTHTHAHTHTHTHTHLVEWPTKACMIRYSYRKKRGCVHIRILHIYNIRVQVFCFPHCTTIPVLALSFLYSFFPCLTPFLPPSVSPLPVSLPLPLCIQYTCTCTCGVLFLLPLVRQVFHGIEVATY